MSVTVAYRRNMHEKIAVIDGRVLWHGSHLLQVHRTGVRRNARREIRAPPLG